jgi:hypothetical protein
MRSSSRSKSSLKISHRNTTSATFEMAHKKILNKKNLTFLPQVHIKILAKFFTI